jgi:hypothetical protein
MALRATAGTLTTGDGSPVGARCGVGRGKVAVGAREGGVGVAVTRAGTLAGAAQAARTSPASTTPAILARFGLKAILFIIHTPPISTFIRS